MNRGHVFGVHGGRWVVALLVALLVSHVSLSSRGTMPRLSVSQAAKSKPKPKPKPCRPLGVHAGRAKQCCSGFTHRHRCSCKAEGEHAKGANQCCSGGSSSSGLCCGELGAGVDNSCATSGCCIDHLGSGAVCVRGSCQTCVEEGDEAPPSDSDCCSGASAGGICCGGAGSGCVKSGCCSDGLLCDDGRCVPCLPEGTPAAAPAQCCSGGAGVDNGMCCGKLGESCATSGCCVDDGFGGVCVAGQCIACIPEGDATPSDSGVLQRRLEGGTMLRWEGRRVRGEWLLQRQPDVSERCVRRLQGARCLLHAILRVLHWRLLQRRLQGHERRQAQLRRVRERVHEHRDVSGGEVRAAVPRPGMQQRHAAGPRHILPAADGVLRLLLRCRNSLPDLLR